MSLEIQTIPKTLPHTFDLHPIANYFNKEPIPAGACALIDLPPNVFMDTEEEINLVAASLWVLCVKFDNLAPSERPNTKEGVAKWINRHRDDVIGRLAGKIEPPFHAWTIDMIQKDVGAMLNGILLKTLPAEKDSKAAQK
ncbi:hypothetical protein I317_03960 [Kwoniella heveanensis CBS 569]|uniref:Uncharacterized protein n=1 Tax=Kwoniella heveanensis BCC8398 TaxID=1296120 RepID=A0A1B9H409_9TREE|nr:hypothetical protein I316_00223 [Kwoniella heveanensis BCC8398]OCF42225.1 hypothetical protein I317_03960 [Kwoniella heveanensis CBS 569]